MKQGLIFIISATSGAGKTTLVNESIKRLSSDFDISKVITYTTRAPRQGETEGKDYYFLSNKKFEQKLQSGFFLETTKYSGSSYGSPKSILEDVKQGKSFVLITDLEGTKRLKKEIPNSILFWIKAPNLEVLKQRLLKRGDDLEKIEKRLKLAKIELKEAEKPRFFDFNIINDNFDKAVQELTELIKKELKK